MSRLSDALERDRADSRQKAMAAQLRERNRELKQALEESVKLQSHYAMLLNSWDGGERMSFKDADAWMNRLEALAAMAGLGPEDK